MNSRVWCARGAAATVLILIVAMAAIASAGCGSEATVIEGPLTLGEADSGKAYTVKVGEMIEVVLPGNMTTGFEWTADLAEKDTALVEQTGEPIYAQESTDQELVGAGGIFTFTFEAVAKGEAELKLVYSRPWESVPPEKTFSVSLKIE